MMIYPSGDTTGITDTKRIREALDSQAVVELDGAFFLNAPLTIKDPSKLIGGNNWATLYWAGGVTDEPMVRITRDETGAYVRRDEAIERIALNCRFKSRGIAAESRWYRPLMRRVEVRQSRQLAVDVRDCWGSTLSDVQIIMAHGMALRVSHCNATEYANVRVSLSYGFWHADAAEAESSYADPRNTGLWLYAAKHGLEKARAEFGVTGREDWPADVKQEDRCAILIAQETHGLAWRNLLLEPNAYGDCPEVRSYGSNGEFSGVYCEGCYHSWSKDVRSALFEFVGDGTGKMAGCSNMVEKVSVVPNPYSSSRYVAKLTGDANRLTVRDVNAYTSLIEAVVCANSEANSEIIVVGAKSLVPTMQDVEYITTNSQLKAT